MNSKFKKKIKKEITCIYSKFIYKYLYYFHNYIFALYILNQMIKDDRFLLLVHHKLDHNQHLHTANIFLMETLYFSLLYKPKKILKLYIRYILKNLTLKFYNTSFFQSNIYKLLIRTNCKFLFFF